MFRPSVLSRVCHVPVTMAALRTLSLHTPLAAPQRAVNAGSRAHLNRSLHGLNRQFATGAPLAAPSHHWKRAGSRRAAETRHRAARANWGQEVVWADAPVVASEPVADLLFSVSLDISGLPEIQEGYRHPGQFVQVRVGDSKPAFLAIASPPKVAAEEARLEFLVKAVEGSTAALLAGVKEGERVGVSAVMGKGFNMALLSPPQQYPSLLLFATGSGISPIRALIEHGIEAHKRSDVRLFFGVRNQNYLPYQDRFAAWEASGVRVVPVFSQPPATWTGATGFVQGAYERSDAVKDGASAGAVLCGHKAMAQEITAILTSQGVPREHILLNF